MTNPTENHADGVQDEYGRIHLAEGQTYIIGDFLLRLEGGMLTADTREGAIRVNPRYANSIALKKETP